MDPVSFRRVEPRDEKGPLRILREEQPGFLILGSREPFGEPVKEFLRRSKIPVLALGEEQGGT